MEKIQVGRRGEEKIGKKISYPLKLLKGGRKKEDLGYGKSRK